MTVLGTESYPSYLDVTTQVEPWLEFQNLSVSETTTEVLNLIVDSICTEAQRFIGGPIGPTTYRPTTGIGKFDGDGGLNSGYIMLPKCPVISITQVVEYRSGKGVTLTEVKPTGTGTVPSGGTGFQINYRTGRMTRVLGGIWNRPFYPGSNNVWVTWTAGYNPIPADLIRASLEWVAHVYRNTQQASGGAVRGSAGEAEPATLGGLWAGIPDRIKAVLQTYERVGIR